MKFREITRELISLLENKSGYPVQVLEEPGLSTIASIQIARGNIPSHILYYRPSPGTLPDYAICWQCVFAMRMFECPPEKRVQIASIPSGEKIVEKLLINGIGRKLRLSQTQIETLKQQLYSGIITHLRSVPIGFRVVSWLGNNYPQLRDLELSFAEQELKMGDESRNPRVRDIIPPEIYLPTNYINAAHAIYWAERLEKPSLINPYRLMDMESHGRKLLEIIDSVPDNPLQDRDMIDNWAEQLQIQDWYIWVPYTAP